MRAARRRTSSRTTTTIASEHDVLNVAAVLSKMQDHTQREYVAVLPGAADADRDRIDFYDNGE